MGIKVNVSEQESQAGDRNFDPLPIGKFHGVVTAVELIESKSEANYGQPMLSFEFTIQDTPGTWQKHANRKDWVNACLWEGALYTIVGILKALPSATGDPKKNAYDDHVTLDAAGNVVDLDIPTEPEFYEGRDIFFNRGKNKKQVEKFPDMPERHVEIRGFSRFDESKLSKAKETEAPF